MSDPARVREALERVPLLERLHADLLARLVEVATVSRHAAGTVLWPRGEPAPGLFFLIQGGVRIDGPGELSCEIVEGESFGEDALADDAPRTTTALCDADAEVVSLRRDDFEDVLFIDRDLAYEMLWRLARALAARTRASAEERVLLELAGRL